MKNTFFKIQNHTNFDAVMGKGYVFFYIRIFLMRRFEFMISNKRPTLDQYQKYINSAIQYLLIKWEGLFLERELR